MGTLEGYLVNVKKELNQSLRVRVRISFKFVAECNRLKYNIVLRLQMKVKYDHRSEFSNLSNWKEEA